MKTIYIPNNSEGLHEFREAMRDLPDVDLEVTLRPAPESRTDRQLNYYWNTVVPACRAGFKELGYDYGLQETHRDLSDRFLYREYEQDGTIQREHMSLKADAHPRVDKETMAFFIERCIRFAAADLMIVI